VRRTGTLVGYGCALLVVGIAMFLAVPVNLQPGDRFLIPVVWPPASISAAILIVSGIFTLKATRRSPDGIAVVLRQMRTLVLAGAVIAVAALLLVARAATEHQPGAWPTAVTIGCCVFASVTVAGLLVRAVR
jgi:hypothetical protein